MCIKQQFDGDKQRTIVAFKIWIFREERTYKLCLQNCFVCRELQALMGNSKSDLTNLKQNMNTSTQKYNNTSNGS